MACPLPPTLSAKPIVLEEELVAPPLEDIAVPVGGTELNDLQSIRLAPVRRSTLTSIGFWGDSHLSAGFLTDEMISLLSADKRRLLRRT